MNIRKTPLASAIALALLSIAPTARAQQAEPSKLETVVVTGIRASREQSLAAKRNADSVVDVVTSEDIGKLPDKNVADAVQRVPGVNITSSAGGEGGFSENDRVSIRGTSPSLTRAKRQLFAAAIGNRQSCHSAQEPNRRSRGRWSRRCRQHRDPKTP